MLIIPCYITCGFNDLVGSPRISRYFECNNYVWFNQHGFRKGHSTASAIFEYVQFSYDCTNIPSSIFIDYSKVFDTIDHDILIKN